MRPEIWFPLLNVDQGTPRHKLGVYASAVHNPNSVLSYIRGLQPVVIRHLDPDVQQLSDAYAAAPQAVLAPRIHAWSDDAEKHEHMVNDPLGTARRHVDLWEAQLDNWIKTAKGRGIPLPEDRRHWRVVGINEPDETNATRQLVEYYVEFLDGLARRGLHGCGYAAGVGHPANLTANHKPDWSPYEPIIEAVIRGKHWLELHEYWWHSGPWDANDWLWWPGRHLQLSLEVPILIGECGVDLGIHRRRWEEEGGSQGWRGHMGPQEYSNQLRWYYDNMSRNVIGIMPFMTDFADKKWESFDTTPAHEYILEWKL